MEAALTESERCLAAILTASTQETSPDRMQMAVERAVDAFKNSANRIKSVSAKRGAVADLVALVDRCRRDTRAHSEQQKLLRQRALDFAESLIKEVGRSLAHDDTLLASGKQQPSRGVGTVLRSME